MNINIKGTNMELTGAITDYVNKKVSAIEEKFSKDIEVTGYVEIGKTTNHHKQGDFFKAEMDLNIRGKKFFVNSEKSDLYVAIDDAKEEIVRELTNNKDRKETLYKRGARSVKKMLKGLSDRNPFTSKY